MNTFLAIDSARASNAFSTGLLAAINPCGFVLLPTYLMYFLGMESTRPGGGRASVARALKVGVAVSAGFMSIFLVIGVITKWQSQWLLDKMPWASLVIAALLVALGVAMLFGYRLPITTPKLTIQRTDRSVAAMFVFGLGYAIASMGCTLPTLTTTVLGGLVVDGFWAGLGYIVLYAVAMGVVVTGLTVSLAMANTWILGFLRKGMQHVETVSAVFVLLSGMYLFYYWYSSLRNDSGNSVTAKAEQWQVRLASFVDRHQTPIVVVLGAVIVIAIGITVRRVRRTGATA